MQIPGCIINNKEHQELNIFAAYSVMTLLNNNNNDPIWPLNYNNIINNNKILG